jgi:hypothetical protein
MTTQEMPQGPSAAPPGPALTRMINGYWLTQMIYTATRLGIADSLAEGPRTAGRLAKHCGAHARAPPAHASGLEATRMLSLGLQLRQAAREVLSFSRARYGAVRGLPEPPADQGHPRAPAGTITPAPGHAVQDTQKCSGPA